MLPEITTSDLSLEASRRALDMADLTPADIDLIIVATCSPDRAVPSVAAYVQRELGGLGATMDLNAACSGLCSTFKA